jgi:hypothetical protein
MEWLWPLMEAVSTFQCKKGETLLVLNQYFRIHRITIGLKVETDIMASVAASLIGWVMILVIMYFETFKINVGQCHVVAAVHSYRAYAKTNVCIVSKLYYNSTACNSHQTYKQYNWLYSYCKFEYEFCTNTTSSSTSFVLILQVRVRVLY